MQPAIRKLKILEAIVDSYIGTGEPVGSKTLCDGLDFNVSSATIRNDMSELAELGLLPARTGPLQRSENHSTAWCCSYSCSTSYPFPRGELLKKKKSLSPAFFKRQRPCNIKLSAVPLSLACCAHPLTGFQQSPAR